VEERKKRGKRKKEKEREAPTFLATPLRYGGSNIYFEKKLEGKLL